MRWGGWIGLVAAALTGCASGPQDIAPYAFSCTQGQFFEARLYRDMAVLEGARGHDQLLRLKVGREGEAPTANQTDVPAADLKPPRPRGDAADPVPDAADSTASAHGFVYGNDRLIATFGLGVDRRLATLRYADIPQTIHCERVQLRFAHSLAAALSGASAPDAPLPPLEIAPVDGPKPPQPPQPIPMEDRIYTNIRFGGGPGPN